MRQVKLNDGSTMPTMVAERLYKSLYRNFTNHHAEFSVFLSMLSYGSRDEDGILVGSFAVYERELMNGIRLSTFHQFERDDLISGFEVDQDSITKCFKTGELKDNYTFKIPEHAERMARNMFLICGNAVKYINPTLKPEFIKDIIKPAHEYSR